jgi:hypothetical protein
MLGLHCMQRFKASMASSTNAYKMLNLTPHHGAFFMLMKSSNLILQNHFCNCACIEAMYSMLFLSKIMELLMLRCLVLSSEEASCTIQFRRCTCIQLHPMMQGVSSITWTSLKHHLFIN